MSIEDAAAHIRRGRDLVGQDGTPAVIQERLEELEGGNAQLALGALFTRLDRIWDNTSDLSEFIGALQNTANGAQNHFAEATGGVGNANAIGMITSANTLQQTAKELTDVRERMSLALADILMTLCAAHTKLADYTAAHGEATLLIGRAVEAQPAIVQYANQYLADIGYGT